MSTEVISLVIKIAKFLADNIGEFDQELEDAFDLIRQTEIEDRKLTDIELEDARQKTERVVERFLSR